MTSFQVHSKSDHCRTSRTKLSTLLKTNIFKYFILFCNKVAKIHSQQRNPSNSNNATYALETCYLYLGSIKHTYISMVKQTISTS